jgi:hypothetical protein
VFCAVFCYVGVGGGGGGGGGGAAPPDFIKLSLLNFHSWR